jgi:succinyl-CoA synthetase alpha subunit
MTSTQELERLLAGSPKVIVQGITGRTGRRHAALMRAYGTNVVGGTSPRAETGSVDGIPVFASCRDAVEKTGATASIAFVPPINTLDAVREAGDAGLNVVITVAEGMPVHDACKAFEYARSRGLAWIGPSTPGLAVPGEFKIGFLPDVCLEPGPMGVMAKSGTLSYEVCYRLKARGFGQSRWVGVGGESVKGTRFADLVPFFKNDERTKALVVIGEIGGSEEEELADRLKSEGFDKPCFAVIAGSRAPQGKTMGHAGALVHGNSGTFDTKSRRLRDVGVEVFDSLDALTSAVVRRMAGKV